MGGFLDSLTDNIFTSAFSALIAYAVLLHRGADNVTCCVVMMLVYITV